MADNIFEKEAVENIQRYLRQLSFHDEDIRHIPVDGIWDSETRNALMAFQKKNSLPVTGVVDRTTWDRLKAEYDRSVALNSPPVKLGLFPRVPAGYSIGEGTVGYLVVIVQYLLDELESIYRFPDLSISGEYDEQTAANVREFQRRNGIPDTGEVNRETWDAMAVQYNLLLNYDQ